MLRGTTGSKPQKPTSSISRIDAYFGKAILLSKCIAPGKPLTLMVATLQPSKPAAAAIARTLAPVHVDAVFAAEIRLPLTFLRNAEVVKNRALPETAPVVVAVDDRPKGLTALAK